VENVVVYVYVKFGDDRLWNEKALADRKSDNNNNTNTNKKNKNNVGGTWRPVSGSKNAIFACIKSSDAEAVQLPWCKF